MGGICSTYGGEERVLLGKTLRKRPLGKPRHSWRHGLDWSGSGKEKVAATCEYGNEHSGFIKCREFLD